MLPKMNMLSSNLFYVCYVDDDKKYLFIFMSKWSEQNGSIAFNCKEIRQFLFDFNGSNYKIDY